MTSCVIDGKPLANGQEMYCSNACKMKAYRRRAADKRLLDAAERRRKDNNQHRNEWCRFLIDAGGCSRKQAERLYTALMSINRLDGPPYEQLSF